MTPEIRFAEYVAWFRKAIIQAVTVIGSITSVVALPSPWDVRVAVLTGVLGQVVVVLAPNKVPAAKVEADTMKQLALPEPEPGDLPEDLELEPEDADDRPKPYTGRHRPDAAPGD